MVLEIAFSIFGSHHRFWSRISKTNPSGFFWNESSILIQDFQNKSFRIFLGWLIDFSNIPKIENAYCKGARVCNINGWQYNYHPCGGSALEKTTSLSWQQWSLVRPERHSGSLLSLEAGGLFQCRNTARAVIIQCITLGLYKFPRLNVRFSISAFFEVNLISASASLDILVMSEFFSLLHWKCIPYGNLFLITRASHSWWEIDRHAGYIFNVTIKKFRHY